jgi:hypothetical protein
MVGAADEEGDGAAGEAEAEGAAGEAEAEGAAPQLMEETVMVAWAADSQM